MLFSGRDLSASPETPRHDLGRRALYASVGGGILAFLGAVGLQGAYGLLPPIATVVIGVALIFGSLALLTRADLEVKANPSAAIDRPPAVRARYLLITRLEYVGFLIALVVCNLLNQMIWLLPVVAIIMGAQYLALGQLLRSVSAWVKGSLLCLLALATMLLAPEFTHPSGAPQIYLWWVVVGLIGGAILWIDAIICLAQGFARPASQGATK